MSLLIGNLLLIAIAAASPLYLDGVLGRLLTRSLEDQLYESGRHPLMITIDSGSTTPMGAVSGSLRDYDLTADELADVYDIEALSEVRFISSGRLSFKPDVVRDGVQSLDLQLASLRNLENHAELLSGELFTDSHQSVTADEIGFGAGDAEDGAAVEGDITLIDVMVTQRTMVNQNILLGDILMLSETSASGDLIEEQGQLAFHVVGIFTAEDPSDPYWVRQDSYYSNHLFIVDDQLDDLLRPGYQDTLDGGDEVEALVNLSGIWNTVFDYTELTPDQVGYFRELNASYMRQMNDRRNVFTPNYTNTLAAFELQSRQTGVTLTLLQVPIYLLLLAFIYMVSKQLLRMEMNEIAVFKSRGASRSQVLLVYVLQSLSVGVLAMILAIPLSFFLTNVIGSADAFLSFVSRQALPLRIQSAFLLALIAALTVGFFTMIIPAFRLSKTTIVEQKQQLQALDQKKPIWQKLFLDLVLLAVSIYALYSFEQQRDSIADRVAAGQGTDGLLFLSSSLFMVGSSLVIWRILPLLIVLIYRMGKNLWGPALYLSFLQTIRSRNRQVFISVFLMLTMSIGLFSAITARTINENARSQIRYLNGTDLIVREFWQSNADAVLEDPELELVYQEPDFAIYREMDEVLGMARVYTNATVNARARNVDQRNVQLMGIHTREFGETVTFDPLLLPRHINNYLNEMAENANAVLVSENFRTNYNLEIGDTIYYNDSNSESVYGLIAGFVPYWPSYQPTTSQEYSDGQIIVTDNYLIVAHLSTVQSSFGLAPYDVWLRTDGESQFLYDFAEAAADPEGDSVSSGRVFTRFVDTNAEQVALNQDPVLQGTNGLLTISYLVVLILCAVGFLIYWILSIRSRTLLFGIFRAMGLRFRELIVMLVHEQLCVTLPALLAGTGIGYVAARLYVPLIMIAYGSRSQVIPLRIQYAGLDFARTLLIVGFTIVLCLLALAWQIRRINIAQALKLGED